MIDDYDYPMSDCDLTCKLLRLQPSLNSLAKNSLGLVQCSL